MMTRLTYLGRMAADRIRGSNLACPNCGSQHASVIDRKYLITELRRCSTCHLMFRVPTDPPDFNETFYNEDYEQGFTTDMPNEADLARLKENGFAGSPKDYTFYISILRQLGFGDGSRLFDFGCSWGYGSWQMQRAGFDVYAVEVSKPRRRFAAKKLGVRIIEDIEEQLTKPGFAGTFDCFFSAHVLEHVPQPGKVFDLAARLLKPGGLFVSFTPNGCAEHRAASSNWSKLWGSVHPNFIDDKFLDHAFPGAPRLISSTRDTKEWLETLFLPEEGASRSALENPELLFVAALPRHGRWNERPNA